MHHSSRLGPSTDLKAESATLAPIALPSRQAYLYLIFSANSAGINRSDSCRPAEGAGEGAERKFPVFLSAFECFL